MKKKIFFVFFFAFLIRLIALNQSLWLDEAVTAKVVMSYRLTDIIGKFSPTDFHPPLYYLFMKLWTNVFGYSEITLRMPSVLFSLMTGWIVFLLGGIWSAAFFLFNPLIIYYSQEARMYLLATLFLTSALYYLFTSLRVNEFKNKLLFGLFISLSFLTFYGSIFLIATMMLYLLFKKQHKTFFVSGLILLVSLLLVRPLLYQQLINSKIALASVTNWSAVLGKANIKNLLLIPIKFSIGRISFLPKWFYWAVAGSWTTLILFVMFKNLVIENFKLKILLIYLLIFPLFLGFIISFFAPMLQYFRFLYLIPIVCLLLGFNQSGQAKFNLGGYVLVGGFLIFSFIYLLNPAFHREDWKSLVKNLPKNIPVYMIKTSSDPVSYYSKNNLRVNELTLLRQDFGGQSELENNIIIIPYVSEIYGLDYKRLLNNSGFKLKKEVSFREVTYEQWEAFYTPQKMQ